MDAIIARAESEGKFARKFQTKGASHTSQMDPLLGELAQQRIHLGGVAGTLGLELAGELTLRLGAGDDRVHLIRRA
ncbi:hypothetical protein C6A85_09625, partial [Mycobacterium sp. ITM-2017-0098]